ncbi:MAG TPA: hypothetical protein VNO33_06490, partial [Kofleriaceae bacterium]|nr:hypothetical protein [Kofleriaceae bacterium]
MTLGLAGRFSLLGILTLLGATSACGFDGSGRGGPGADDGSDGDGEDGGDDDDGGIGGRIDAGTPDAEPDICLTWNQAAPFDPCAIALAERGGDLILDAPGIYTYDTDSGQLLAPGGAAVDHESQLINDGDLHLVSAQQLTVEAGSTLRIEGSVPILLVGWNRIDVNGEIDLTSSIGSEDDGAGADPTAACAGTTAGVGGDSATGAGGGGGGGFGGLGGAGGPGGSGTGAAGAAGEDVSSVNDLRGGCPGANGGVADDADANAQGGSGGGAIALSALNGIAVAGVVEAGGAGGSGAGA